MVPATATAPVRRLAMTPEFAVVPVVVLVPTLLTVAPAPMLTAISPGWSDDLSSAGGIGGDC